MTLSARIPFPHLLASYVLRSIGTVTPPTPLHLAPNQASVSHLFLLTLHSHFCYIGEQTLLFHAVLYQGIGFYHGFVAEDIAMYVIDLVVLGPENSLVKI